MIVHFSVWSISINHLKLVFLFATALTFHSRTLQLISDPFRFIEWIWTASKNWAPEPKTWGSEPKTWGPEPKTWASRTQDQGARTQDLGARTQDLGARIQDMGARTQTWAPEHKTWAPESYTKTSSHLRLVSFYRKCCHSKHGWRRPPPIPRLKTGTTTERAVTGPRLHSFRFFRQTGCYNSAPQ